MISKELRSDIVRYAHRMDAKGWCANHDGNISVQMESGGFALTPGARAKFTLQESDILEVDAKGTVTNTSNGKTFSEWAIHQAVYSKRSDVGAVVHAHPPAAMAVGSANQEMTTWPIPEAVVSIGPGVPLVGIALPGSDAFFEEFRLLLPHYDAVMVAGNGVFAWGTNLEQAFLRLELVEHLADIFIRSMVLGGPKPLPSEAIAALLKKRVDAGLARPEDPARLHWFQK